MPRHFVHVTQATIAQLILNGFEAFIVKHKGHKESTIEMWGTLYGHTEEKSTTQHHHIEFISIDTSAKMARDYCISSPETQALKETMANAIGFKLLGGLHTHPYLDEEMSLNMVREQGSDFSEEDRKAFQSDLQNQPTEKRSVVQMVLTIRNSLRQNTARDGKIDDNLFEFSIGNAKCFLRAQVFTLDEDGELFEEPTILKSDYLSKFGHITGNFGRIVKDGGKSNGDLFHKA